MVETFKGEIPIGFSMELAQNLDAMRHFSKLSEADQMSVINGARQVGSKQEMQDYVNKLVQN